MVRQLDSLCNVFEMIDTFSRSFLLLCLHALEFGTLSSDDIHSVHSILFLEFEHSEGSLPTHLPSAIFSSMQAFINPGDEVIMFEPFYDCYPASVTMAGGKPVGVPLLPPRSSSPLHSSNWQLDIAKLEKSITSKTKMIMVNNPHNPTGKVFSLEELQQISRLAIKHDLIVLADEVYEFLIYEGVQHHRIINLPGMWERTIYVGSAGKTFSATGWKIGWVIGDQKLVNSLHLAHQWIPFCVTTPMQEAVAVAFEQTAQNNYFPEFQKMFQNKRDKLLQILTDAGLEPTVPLGSYFILGKTDRLLPHVTTTTYPKHMNDWNVCTWMTENIGVAAIPLSAFYSPENQASAQGYARFTFCKREDVLDQAAMRLQKIKTLSN
eukprot:TRINITY_DN1944_c0_g1_i5.p1 TRINITY_DN1944_c0_g1~~TRINITY_DN1944_c0_g1_i5.p1  ORF type:complete len:378 (-),score=82.28 TRINITY_DN1944_c0_g1_i5:201-1334(-)